MTSFATELATPSVTDVRYVHYVRTPYRVQYTKIKIRRVFDVDDSERRRDRWSLSCPLSVACLIFSRSPPPSPPVNNSRAMMIVCKIRGKIVRTILCCIVYSNSAHIYEQFVQVCACFFMVALCNRETIYIFILFLSSFFFLLSSFFSSRNLSGRRLDVYHTLAHGVALVRI